MTTKYYVETEEETTYSDSEADKFHHDKPHNSIDDAKTWALANPGKGIVTIYECVDNVIKPILIRGSYDMVWEEYE